MTGTHSDRVVRVAGTPTAALLRADDYLAELQRELELVRLSHEGGGQRDDPADVLASISAILTACAAVRAAVRSDAERCAAAGSGTFDALLRLPPAAGATAAKLRDLIRRAVAIAEQGLVLTVPPAPEVGAFIDWWLGTVVTQLSSDGLEPATAWRDNGATATVVRLAVQEPPRDPQPPDADNGRRAVRARFEPTLTASRRARDLLRRVEHRWGREELCEVAELPLSELVTNAVLHAQTTIEIAVCFVDESLRVEVHDEQPDLHAPRSRDPDACTGRGLELVGAIADRWGVTTRPAGKTVWFEVDPAS